MKFVKLFFTVVFSLLFFLGFCQTEDKPFKLCTFAHKAIADYKIDSAIASFKEVLVQYPTYRTTNILSNIAACYLYKNDSIKAVEYYKKCVNSGEKYGKDITFFKNRACVALAEYYYYHKEYNVAIHYYDLSKTFKSNLLGCGIGEFERNMLFAFHKAQCFFELKKYDSVVSLLSSTAFIPIKDLSLEQSEYEDIAILYTSAIYNLYGKLNTFKMIDEAIDKATYLILKDNISKDHIYTITSCKINFANTIIELNYNGWQVELPDDKLPVYFTKAFLINDFKQSLVYKIIHNINVVPISKRNIIETHNPSVVTL